MSGRVGRVHVIGAGLAGLSAALHLSQATTDIVLHEAAGQAGGRCRSYFDRELGCRIDNGNHLVLSGNVIMRDYLMLAGAEDTLTGPDRALFPFMDLASGERWTLAMNRGVIPWSLFTRKGRVPGTKLPDYLSVIRMLRAAAHETVAELTRHTGLLYERFWQPLCIAVLNTPAEIGSARLLGNVLAQSFALGGRACRPLVPKIGMSETFVDPCLTKLREMGVPVKLNRRLRNMEFTEGRIARLDFNDGAEALGKDDWVILAVPPWVAQELVPDLKAPHEFSSILNAHYRIDLAAKPPGFAGLVGGVAEWVFMKPGIVSVTVSAADRYDSVPAAELSALIWRDVARLLDLDGGDIPPCRIVKEKRATFAATPAQDALRPKCLSSYRNLLLAGDWTQNGLPSTIEGSIRTGLRAAQILTRWMGHG